MHRLNDDRRHNLDFEEPYVCKSHGDRKMIRFSPFTGSSNSPIMLDEDSTVRLILSFLFAVCVHNMHSMMKQQQIMPYCNM